MGRPKHRRRLGRTAPSTTDRGIEPPLALDAQVTFPTLAQRQISCSGATSRLPTGYRIELVDRSAKCRSSKPSLDCRDDLVRPRHRRHVADSVEFDELGIGEDLHERPAELNGDDRVGGAVQDQHG